MSYERGKILKARKRLENVKGHHKVIRRYLKVTEYVREHPTTVFRGGPRWLNQFKWLVIHTVMLYDQETTTQPHNKTK